MQSNSPQNQIDHRIPKEEWDKLDSYSREIAQQYSKRPELKNMPDAFTTFHSDYLNIQARPDGIYAKCLFKDDDIIAELRGQYTTLQKMKPYLGKYDFRPLQMLWMDKEKGILLKPNELGCQLLRNVSKQGNNCWLESHYNSKILVRAKGFIAKNQKLIVDQKDYERLIYLP